MPRLVGSVVLTGLAWALAWMPLGLLVGVVLDPDGAMDEPWMLVGIYPGFLCGALFAGVLAVAEGRRKAVELPLLRVGAWGALVGLLVGSLPFVLGSPNPRVPVWLLAVSILGSLTIMSAVSAVGSALWFRRRGGKLTIGSLCVVLCVTAVLPSGCAPAAVSDEADEVERTSSLASASKEEERNMQIFYLEIVTEDVAGVCSTYEALHAVEFGDADDGLGGARTAALPDGGKVGVRAPLRESEEPVVRPYWLVDDIEGAVAAAEEAGAMIAHPPLEIPGHGTFAIYFEGGVQHGLWQRP